MKYLLVVMMLVAWLPVAHGADPLLINAARDMSITNLRATQEFGWEIQAQVDSGDLLGKVTDNLNVYKQEPYLESGTDGLVFYIKGIGETPAITAGDSVTFTYLTVAAGGEVSKKIFLPAVIQDTKLYIGDDNCSYSDSARSSKVGMTPTLTPITPTPSTTPTTTPTPTAIPTPSVTPTPVNAGIWYRDTDTIYPVIPGDDLDLSGDLSVQTDADVGGTLTATTFTDQSMSVTAGVFSGIVDLGTVVTADIDGGSIDGTVIGAASALAGSFSTVGATGRITASEATTTDVTGIAGYFSETVSGTHGLTAPTYAIGSYGKCNASMYAGTDVYMAGAVGYYGVTGTNASVYPVGAVIGWVGGETTTADGAFVAVLGGDSGITRAGAAYTVRSTNSTPGTYFDYGIDFNSGTIVDYSEVTYNTAEIRLGKGATIDNLTVGIVNVIGDLQVRGAFNYAGTSASTGLNTYVLDATPDMVVTAPTLGQYISWTSDTAGDGASTLSVDGVADTLQDRAGNATTAGDVIVGPMQAQFDGTNWRLIGI